MCLCLNYQFESHPHGGRSLIKYVRKRNCRSSNIRFNNLAPQCNGLLSENARSSCVDGALFSMSRPATERTAVYRQVQMSSFDNLTIDWNNCGDDET